MSTSVVHGTITNQQVPQLIAVLENLLPYSIPLTRRLQFHLRHPSPTAHVYIAGFTEQSEQSSAALWLEKATEKDFDSSRLPWIAAYLDLTLSGQTQGWLFASWEVPNNDQRICHSEGNGNSSEYGDNGGESRSNGLESSLAPSLSSAGINSSDTTNIPTTTTPRQRQLLMLLFKYICNDLVPELPTEPTAEWLELARTGKILSKPYSRSKVIFGTVHQCLWECFSKEPTISMTRTDMGYWKYIFTSSPGTNSSTAALASSSDHAEINEQERSTFKQTQTTLPQGFTLRTPMREQDLQTVLDRTVIPRTIRTLRQLVSVGLYDEANKVEAAIGWGFLGKDASLSSLHTEDAYRGKGFAVMIGRELLRLQNETFTTSNVTTSGSDAAAEEYGDGERHVEDSRTLMDVSRVEKGKDHQVPFWGHADVSSNNVPSQRAMEKLGGKVMWSVAWIEVDLAKLVESSQA